MSVGPSSPLPGARGPGPGGRAAPPPRRLTGRPWPLPLPSRPVAASSSSPHPARAQSARRPRAPPPAPHSSPPLPGGGCGASPERARVPRPEDGWMERARTRACARAPLSPLPRRGREAMLEEVCHCGVGFEASKAQSLCSHPPLFLPSDQDAALSQVFSTMSASVPPCSPL